MTYSPNDLSAEQILAIPENAPEKLFSGELELAKNEYYALGRLWHPDRNPDFRALRVFQHLSVLYRNAGEQLKNNTWRGRGELLLLKSGDLMRTISFLKSEPFELGDMYIGRTEVVFSVRREFEDLFDNAKRQIAGFRYANSGMQREVERYLPREPEYYSTGERLIMVVKKPSDLVLLEDLRIFLGGEMDARHVAWIESSLHNLSCYFDYAGIVHNDIGPGTYFVSPKNHTGMLLGGWWYAQKTGARLKAFPPRTMRFAPPDVIRKKQADARVDLELIRATARELFNDPNGARLRKNKKIPAAFANWLNGATSGEAVFDYKLWKYALEMSFGKPQFIKLAVEANAIYK